MRRTQVRTPQQFSRCGDVRLSGVHLYDRSKNKWSTSRLRLLDLSTAGVEFVTVLVKGLKLSGLNPVEAVEGKLPES